MRNETSPLDLDLDIQLLPLQRLPIGSLPAEIQAVWAEFSPRGLVDVQGRLVFDGRQWQPDLAIRCHDLSLEYSGFRYRLTDGTGVIDLKPNSVAARLRLIGGGQTIECRADLQQLMWDAAGLSRNATDLSEAAAELATWAAPEVNDQKSAEDANLLVVAKAVIASALAREESRGGHYRTDFPARDDENWLHHITCSMGANGPVLGKAPVTITRWQPQERKY